MYLIYLPLPIEIIIIIDGYIDNNWPGSQIDDNIQWIN